MFVPYGISFQQRNTEKPLGDGCTSRRRVTARAARRSGQRTLRREALVARASVVEHMHQRSCGSAAQRERRAPRLGRGLSRAARAKRPAARRGARRVARALAHAACQLHTGVPRARRVGALGRRQRKARVGRTVVRACLLGALARLFAHLAEHHAANEADCEPDADTSNPNLRMPLVSLPLSATELTNQFVSLLVAFIAPKESQLDRINEGNVELRAELCAGDAPIDESLLAPMVLFVAVWAVVSVVLSKATATTRVNRFLVVILLKEFASYSLICKLLKETDESVCDSYYLLLPVRT